MVVYLGFGALILTWVTEFGRDASSSHSPKKYKQQLSNEVVGREIRALLKCLTCKGVKIEVFYHIAFRMVVWEITNSRQRSVRL